MRIVKRSQSVAQIMHFQVALLDNVCVLNAGLFREPEEKTQPTEINME